MLLKYLVPTIYWKFINIEILKEECITLSGCFEHSLVTEELPTFYRQVLHKKDHEDTDSELDEDNSNDLIKQH